MRSLLFCCLFTLTAVTASAQDLFELERVTVATDYFSAAATTRHLQPEASAHHLVFGGVDLALASGWEFGLSPGHCVTRHEPWVVRSMIGFAF